MKYFKIFALVLTICTLSMSSSWAQSNFPWMNSGPSVGSYAELIKQIGPAVVNISTTQTVKIKSGFDEFFQQHYGLPKSRKQNSLGSGFIIDKDGNILTNNHVVRGADEIFVTLSDGETLPASIIGRDERTDVAIIKIKGRADLPTVQLGDSDIAQVGDWVLAIGNPFGLGQTVTAGIISAKGRHIGAGPYDDFIQTDASINPGNSGGPLFNTKGEVVGVNTAIVQSGQGIGFAIPVNMLKPMLPQLIKSGKVSRGYLGISIQDVPPPLAQTLGLKAKQGALVSDVIPASPAALAGIMPGDIILAYDGKSINNSAELPLVVSQSPIGKIVQIDFLRRNKKITVQAKVGDMARVPN